MQALKSSQICKWVSTSASRRFERCDADAMSGVSLAYRDVDVDVDNDTDDEDEDDEEDEEVCAISIMFQFSFLCQRCC
jgi:hypothetical protein